MTRSFRAAAIVLCTLVSAASAVAQPTVPAPTGVWDSLIVPGGFAALQHATRVAPPAEAWRTLPMLIELSFAGNEGLRYTRQITDHAALLRDLHRRRVAATLDGSLSLALRQRKAREVDQLLETLGLEVDRRGGAVRQRSGGDVDRLAALRLAGLQLDRLVERLNAGESVPLVTADALAPLPIGTGFWQARFEPTPPPHDLLWAILGSREMAALYYGLLSMDDATLAAVGSDAKLTDALVRHALVVPTLGGALRIAGGRIVVPGGAAAEALWVDVVGEPLDRPAAFVNALLKESGGRLAYLYRTLAALPEASAAVLMGVGAMPAKESRDAFRRLTAAFTGALGDWVADALRPPPLHGPEEVLFSLIIADGRLAGPRWRDFWRRALGSDGWPGNPAREVSGIEPRDQVDTADLLSAVCPGGVCDPSRLGAVLLLQRESPAPAIGDAASLLVAARTRLRYPALASEVERMRLADPGAYAELGAMAARLDQLDQPGRAIAVVQFQAAVVMLSRLRAVGAPASRVRQYVTELGSLRLTGAGFDGALVAWLSGVLAAKEGEDADTAAIRTLAGDGLQTVGPPFEWEGITYRVDVATSEEARVRASRERFTANSLATAVGLADHRAPPPA